MYESEDLGIEIYVFNNRQYELVDYIQYNPVYKKEISSSFQKKLSELRKQIKPLKTNRQQIEKMFGKTEERDLHKLCI